MRKMLHFVRPLLFSYFLITQAICFSQVTEKWVKRQNGDPNSSDAANDLAVDHKGNVYVTGRSQGKGTNADYTTIRYDDDGDKEWEKRYNGTGNGEDEAVAIVTDHKGNVYVTGWSVGSGTGRDFATVKYDVCLMMAADDKASARTFSMVAFTSRSTGHQAACIRPSRHY